MSCLVRILMENVIKRPPHWRLRWIGTHHLAHDKRPDDHRDDHGGEPQKNFHETNFAANFTFLRSCSCQNHLRERVA